MTTLRAFSSLQPSQPRTVTRTCCLYTARKMKLFTLSGYITSTFNQRVGFFKHTSRWNTAHSRNEGHAVSVGMMSRSGLLSRLFRKVIRVLGKRRKMEIMLPLMRCDWWVLTPSGSLGQAPSASKLSHPAWRILNPPTFPRFLKGPSELRTHLRNPTVAGLPRCRQHRIYRIRMSIKMALPPGSKCHLPFSPSFLHHGAPLPLCSCPPLSSAAWHSSVNVRKCYLLQSDPRWRGR